MRSGGLKRLVLGLPQHSQGAGLHFVAIKGFEPLSTILHGFGRRVCYMGRKPASSHLFITRGVSGLQLV